MKDLFQKCVDFLKEGNNMYYAIGAVVLIVLIVAAVVIISIKKRRVKESNSQTATRIEKLDREKMPSDQTIVVEKPKTVVKAVDDSGYGYQDEQSAVNDIIKEREKAEDIQKENDLIKTVEVKPVEHKTKPIKPVEPVKEPLVYAKKEVEDEEVANKRPGTIQIYRDAADKFRFRFWAANSLMVGHSRAYDNKPACRKAINEIKKIADMAVIADTTKGEEPNVAAGTPIFEIYRDSENKFRFRLVTGIRVTKYLLASQGYTTKENCLKGIASVRYISGNHKINDSSKNAEKAQVKEPAKGETDK